MQKVSHIHHLEDLALMNYQSAKSSLVALEQESYSIKYDGMPALVFGICPVEQKFFLSSKSYFNKTPKINYSVSDIHKNHGARSPGLVEKLEKLWPTMNEFYKNYPSLHKDSNIFQADLLFHKDIEDGSRTPNNITYKFKKRAHSVDYEMVLAIHTRYDRHGNAHPMGHHCDENTLCGRYYIPDKTITRFDNNGLISPKEYYDLEEAFSHISDESYEKTSLTNINVLLKEINSLVRNRIEINEQTLGDIVYKYNYPYEILRVYLALLRYKRSLIDYLDKRSSCGDLEMYIGDDQVGHEGYVTRSGGTFVKLVNRDIFSHANFEKFSG